MNRFNKERDEYFSIPFHTSFTSLSFNLESFSIGLEGRPFFIGELEEFSTRDVTLRISGILEGIESVLVDQSLLVPETFGQGQVEVVGSADSLATLRVDGDDGVTGGSLSVVVDTSENENLVGVDLGSGSEGENVELGIRGSVDGDPGVISNGVLFDGVAQGGLGGIASELVNVSALEDADTGVSNSDLHGSERGPSVSNDVVSLTAGKEDILVDTTKNVDFALVVGQGEGESGGGHITLLDQSLVLRVVEVGLSALRVIGVDTADQEDSAIGDDNGTVIGRDQEGNVQVDMSETSIGEFSDAEALGIGLEVVGSGGNSVLEVVVEVHFESFASTSLEVEGLDGSGLVLVGNVLESSLKVGVESVVALVVLSFKDFGRGSDLFNESSVVGRSVGFSVSDEFNVVSEGSELSVVVLEDTVTGLVNGLGEDGGQSEEIRVDLGLFTENGFFESLLNGIELVVVNVSHR